VAPEAIRTRLARAILPVFVALAAAAPAHALRLVDYNVTNYPGVLFPQRQPYFRTIMAPLTADMMTCEEFTSQAGVDSFLTNVLNVVDPGQWAAAPFVNGNDTDNAFFYKPAKVQFLGMWTFYPNPASLLRLVGVYRVKPVGYSSDAAELRIYVTHLKASTGFESQRLAEATGIRDSMNAMPPGTHAMVVGDFNLYTSAEPAYGKFLESQVNNVGQAYDILPAGAWHNTASFAGIHTQCPCLTCPTGSGFSGGGLDDRFDFFLPTLNLGTGQGLAFVPGTYISVGQDGQHFNKNITDAPTIPQGAAYASALWNASDHLPIRMDLQVPSRLQLSPLALDFGSVIVGAVTTQDLLVSNPAALPGDGLDYSFSASAGFSAPVGGFTEAAGDAPAAQPIGIDASTIGAKSGTLTVTSDDPDQPSAGVPLSGTVLDHADASLDSLALVTDAPLDFGTHDIGQFPQLLARTHNRGYNALRARLWVTDAQFTGGDGRFSIVGGFHDLLVSGTAASFPIAFNDNGATDDTDYNGTLTFTTFDEDLPGAAPAATLTVQLHAHTSTGTTGVGDGLPTSLRFDPPRPNPTAGASWFHFDLPRPAPVTLEIFDLAGRRVASLASGERGAGRYDIRWDGTTEGGARPQAGLYFARFATPGLHRVARLVLMP
jgi:hypothetical protein